MSTPADDSEDFDTEPNESDPEFEPEPLPDPLPDPTDVLAELGDAQAAKAGTSAKDELNAARALVARREAKFRQAEKALRQAKEALARLEPIQL